MTKRKEDINFKDQEIQDLDELKSKLEEIENAKRLQQKENKFLESINEEEKNLNQNLHTFELDLNNKKRNLNN